MGPGSAPKILEEDRLDILGADATWRRDERTDLAAPHESPAAELDALEPARPGPPADRGWREVDVGRGQDLGRLREGDPVRRSRHVGQSVVFAAPASAGFDVAFEGASADVLSDDVLSDDVLSDDVLSDDVPPSDVDPPSFPDPSEPVFEAPDLAVARRSFLAQPEPL